MRVRALVLPVILLMAPFFPPTVDFDDVTSREVEGELMCQCDCTMVVDVCDCGTADQIRERIAVMIDQGQDKDQIVASFVSQYGEEILSSPTKKGFNLVAWIGPFAAVVIGAIGLFFLLRAWAAKGKSTETPEEAPLEPPVSLAETDGYRNRLEAELEQFREEGA